MPHRIALNFEDGVTRFIDCGDNELVADAAYRLGLNIPMDCRDGACGTCKSHCESGEYSLGSYIEDAMSEAEAAERYVLTCQMRAKSDCVIKIASSSALCKIKPSTFESSLHELQRLSPSAIRFSLKLADEALLAFLPGQYMQVGVPGTNQSRAYSFSSMPKDRVVEFLVRHIPAGLMSDYLAIHAKPGDTIPITGPIGSFYLRDIKRPILFLAGGTGLAPFLAMLEEIARTGTSQPIHLIYGVTLDADLVEVEKLDEFTRRLPLFTYATCVAAPESQHQRKGYVTHHLPDTYLNGGDVDLYLCGPPAMVDAVRGYLDQKGIKPANFYFEKFLAAESSK